MRNVRGSNKILSLYLPLILLGYLANTAIQSVKAQLAQCTGSSANKITCMNERRGIAKKGYAKNQQVPVYITVSFDRRTSDLGDILPDPYTAQFFPRVDTYTNMTVSNSSEIWNSAESAGAYDNLLVNVNILGYDNTANAITLYQPESARKWCSNNQLDPSDTKFYYVAYRSIIVTLEDGFIKSVKWEPTYCFGSNKICVDGMFTNICPVTTDGTLSSTCRLSIFLLWAGTDLNGLPLTSSSNSRWNLEKFRIF